MKSPAQRVLRRMKRVEEASASLLAHVTAGKPAADASYYAKESWHRDLLQAARRYGRAMDNLARNR